MFFGTQQDIHTLRYRSSGSRQPEQRWLTVTLVPYHWSKSQAPCFLATADLQGRELGPKNRLLGEQVAEEVALLQKWGTVPELDFCLLCGDFYDYPDCHKRGGTGDVTTVLNAFAPLSPTTFAVLGNHDLISPESLDPRITLLDGGPQAHGPLRIGGVSGITGNPERNQRKSEADFLRAIATATTPYADILLLHQGPQGPSEEYRGWDGVNESLAQQTDTLVVFGHCYWPKPIYSEAENTFCNVDSRVLIFVPATR